MTYRLSNSLPFLIARLGFRANELFTRTAKTHGLTIHSFRVLGALMEEERPLRLSELATLTSIDLSTLSRLVSGMHRKGLLTRDRPESDRRSLQLIPTARGRALASRLMLIAADFEECEAAGLTPREVTALKATLKQLYRNVDRLEEELAERQFAEPVKIPTDAVQEQLAVLYDVGE